LNPDDLPDTSGLYARLRAFSRLNWLYARLN
jgi:hypothetical protein